MGLRCDSRIVEKLTYIINIVYKREFLMFNNSPDEPQVKWYDWLAAFFVADLMLAFTQLMFFAPDIVLTLVSGALVYGLYRFWEEFYCPFRKRKEDSKRK